MDPRHIDADLDYVFFYANPDPTSYILAFHLQINADPDLVPDPAHHFDTDPDAVPDPDFYLMRILIFI